MTADTNEALKLATLLLEEQDSRWGIKAYTVRKAADMLISLAAKLAEADTQTASLRSENRTLVAALRDQGEISAKALTRASEAEAEVRRLTDDLADDRFALVKLGKQVVAAEADADRLAEALESSIKSLRMFYHGTDFAGEFDMELEALASHKAQEEGSCI